MDNVSKEVRRKTMRAIKSHHSKMEDKVITALWRKGLRFRRNVGNLEGKPDIAIKKYKLVIFIDSCFWHGCELHCRMPQSNTGYWQTKIQRNKNRDREVNEHYVSKNWKVLRIWEHDLKEDFDETINKIANFKEYYSD
jgi:DNA mismatch endonuclease (patch repair protein)